MRSAEVTAEGDRIRWVELPGVQGHTEPARVYLHGLGASSPAYFADVAGRAPLAGRRSLLLDLMGHGISDRPEHFSYSLEAHADAVAAALRAAGAAGAPGTAQGAEVVAHSMGGSVAVVLAARHPDLVSRLVLVDANLDPLRPERGALGSRDIASYDEEEFLAGGWAEVRERAGEHWWSTMRLAGRRALHRSAVCLVRGSTPTMRELLLGLRVPRAYLHPEADGPLPGAAGLAAAGVSVVAVPECGHNVMLDNPEGFVRATAAALAYEG
ncbi:alpha/beta fold hydrolase [Streptomyces sp. Da 82-17]|uniref:alpha/beta fold hydrolase n=1 Tax=Streptomyces sp. Da 82-17 TaxID=3377116 RepID=UPI0038D3B5AD